MNGQTQYRGSNEDEYNIYLACADDGKGGDITRGGATLLTYEEWRGDRDFFDELNEWEEDQDDE